MNLSSADPFTNLFSIGISIRLLQEIEDFETLYFFIFRHEYSVKSTGSFVLIVRVSRINRSGTQKKIHMRPYIYRVTIYRVLPFTLGSFSEFFAAIFEMNVIYHLLYHIFPLIYF